MPFLKVSLSFATSEALGEGIKVNDRLQISLKGFAKISTPSFKNLPERLSMSAAFETSMFCVILKTSSEVSLRCKGFSIINFE